MTLFNRSILGCTILGLLMTSSALAWAPVGHEIVAEIAMMHLTPEATKAVRSILGRYQQLGDYDIASWPDIIRGNKEFGARYPNNGSWHFIDFDAGLWYDDNFKLERSADGNDIVGQIWRWRNDLRSGGLKGEDRLNGLRFLVHFVGDIHQPMHCAFRYGDMGGNMLPVNSFAGQFYSYDGETEQEYSSSLHSVWDFDLINEFVAGRETRAIAKALNKEITREQVSSWMSEDVMQWAVEGYWVARKQAYRMTNGDKVPYKWMRPGMDLTRENYIDSHLPIVPEQLKRAGIRLAGMLNTAFDPSFQMPVREERKPQ